MEKEVWTFQDAVNDKQMRLLWTRWYVPKSLKCEKIMKKERCDMFPCEKQTFFRMKKTSSIDISFNNGGGCSGKQMYLCYTCFKKHEQNVKAAKEREQTVVYTFEHWKRK